ncbi:Bromodomain and PHD finger-containing protein [Actinidia chinensis var. chinensis]|uniref:Bromodomain and PHD finger-containing protein n=1 Tax=Actinidia chinensis var. chinensis TaxID=1590841 RepID=A0A2R6P6I0_ACTCC|nr:Bromodomain and PHD finger-containing protein [Actinidia chinensis var. chinensis]
MAKRKGMRGRKRNSARILALETSKKAKKESIINNKRSPSIDTQQQHNETPSPPPPPPTEGAEDSGGRPSKGRKKKRLDKVAVSSIGLRTQQHGEKPQFQGPPVNGVFPSTQRMPEKRVLEFILDILQRRDTHEIFARPVDAEEVEGYYSIVEKPMDFGTMRAKLQEGIYTSFEQFENDVFLITNNAMLFNSSATIYFRQARAIHELAKRVFHTLKMDPEKIELEFSLTRRRYGRKRQVESGGDLPFKVGAKLRRTSLACRESFGAKLSDNEILHGCSDGRDVNFCEAERRQTYNPQTSTVSEESIVSTVYSFLQQLVPGNGGIGYKESLLRFVKDLGPIAQKVANWKLLRLTQIPSHSVLDASLPIYPPAAPQPPSCMDSVINGVTVDVNNQSGSHGATSNGKNILTCDSFNIDSGACRGKTALGIGRLDILGDASKGKSVFTVPHCDIMGTHSALQGEKDCCTIKANDRAVYRDMNRFVGSGPLCDQVQPPHWASRSQPGLLEFSINNSRPKSSVYPSKVIKSTGSNRASALMHGLGKESDAPTDLSCGASSGLVSKPLEWGRPSPWVPKAIGEVDQYLPVKPSNLSLLSQDAFQWQQMQSRQVQPGGVNPLGQDVFMQPSRLNLLGQDVFMQPEPQFPAVSYLQPLPSEVSSLGQNAFVQPSDV